MTPERFWSKADRSGGPGACWPWQACTRADGYGASWNGQKSDVAHRIAYRLAIGPIPAGLTLDHLCRNRACVNPDHLEPVTQRTNVLRGEGITARLLKRTHCSKGHPWDEANTLWYRGTRRCRRCGYLRVRTQRGLAAA